MQATQTRTALLFLAATLTLATGCKHTDRADVAPADTPLEKPRESVAPPPATPIHWRANNGNANDMTGDVDLSATTLKLLKKDYALTPAHTLTHTEILAAANLFSTTAPNGSAAYLYKVNVPPSAKLLNKDPMCPSGPATYLMTLTVIDPQYRAEDLYLGFFSGPNPPALVAGTLSKDPNSCGTFNFIRETPAKP